MNIFSKLLITCSIFTLAHPEMSTIDDQIKDIKNHKMIKFEKADNPVKVTVTNRIESRKKTSEYSEINKQKLTRKEKSDKFHTDNAIKHNLQRHAQGLTETAIQPENRKAFAGLDHDEIAKQLKTSYLASRNRAQQEDLIAARKDYKEATAHFDSKTRPEALQSIHKLRKKIKENDAEIKNLQEKISKKSINNADRQQLQTQIQYLLQNNRNNQQSVIQHLRLLEKNKQSIDQDATNRNTNIISHYQAQDKNVMQQVNGLLYSHNKVATLSTKPKVAIPVKKVVNVEQQEPEATFQPSIPYNIQAESPVLEASIAATEQSLTNEKMKKNPNYNKIQYLTDELAHLKKAKRHKDTYLR